jgi:hypothetical protein
LLLVAVVKLDNPIQLFPSQTKRFLDKYMLSRPKRVADLLAMGVVVRGHDNNIYRGIIDKLAVTGVSLRTTQLCQASLLNSPIDVVNTYELCIWRISSGKSVRLTYAKSNDTDAEH